MENSQTLPSCHIERFTPYRGELSYLEGIIESDPVYQTKNITFVLNAKSLKIGKSSRSRPSQKVCGKVLVKAFIKEGSEKAFFEADIRGFHADLRGFIDENIRGHPRANLRESAFNYGDRLLLEGRLYKTFNFPISERLNYRDYLRNQGIYSIFSVKKGNLIRRIRTGEGNRIVSFALQTRHRLKKISEESLSPLSSSILNAVILGERYKLPKYVNEILINSGTVHIISISGLHLAIVAFLILAVFKIARMSKKFSYILTLPILIIYCLLTGSKIPVIRSMIMVDILLIGYILERKADIFNSLSLAALIILFFNPWQLFDISFQLSFMSIISIVWLFPKIKGFFPKNLMGLKLFHILIDTFSVSFAAWLGLLPLIAYYFRIVSPITVLANMIVVPYSTVVIASGFAFLLMGLISPIFATIFSTVNEAIITFLLKITSLLIRIPFSYFYIPTFPFYIILIYYLLVFIVFSRLFNRVG